MKRYRIFQIIGLLIVFSMIFAVSGPGTATPFDLASNSFQTAPLPIESSFGSVSPQFNTPQAEADMLEAMSPSDAYTVTLGAWRNIRPTESYLRDVSLLPSSYDVDCSSPDQKSEGWIVGESGVILSYCNGVWDHAIIAESLPTTLFGVQALEPTLGVAVGEEGAVLMYLWDQIAKDWVWTKSPIPLDNYTLFSVSMVPDGNNGYTGFAVGEAKTNGQGTIVKGTIMYHDNGGTPYYTYSWEDVTDDYPSLPQVDFFHAIHMLSPTNGWAVGGKANEKGVLIHWDGSNWSLFQEVGSYSLLGISMNSTNDGWAVGKGGSIYHFDGSSWSSVPSPSSGILLDVGFTPTGEGWIVGYDGEILRYTGDIWNAIPVEDRRTDAIDFRALDFNSGHGWAVGFHGEIGIGGHILELDEGLWLAVTPPTDNRLNDISVISDNNAWAVGLADGSGGTIIHWDGEHWQRWYQHDLPIPAIDLNAIDMISSSNGWAAGDPENPGEPAIMLYWDGNRWARPRYDAPINVRINDIAMFKDKEVGANDFGWAVASTGNAVAKYDGASGYWSANHTCQGIYYNLRSASIITSTNTFGWDAWAVGTAWPETTPRQPEAFLRYMGGCSGGYAWDVYQIPSGCPDPPPPNPDDGPTATVLRGIEMIPDTWGFAVGGYRDRASVYYFDGFSWSPYYCQSQESPNKPGALYSVDIIPESGVTWMGGYYTSPVYGKVAYITYKDSLRFGWGGSPIPWNGTNIYHRPIKSLEMSSDTMGWAVGSIDVDSNFSVIYQYPYPNFTLRSTPEFRAVRPGGSASFDVSVNTIGGFNTSVSLSSFALPEGVSVNITPSTVDASTDAAIEIQTSSSTPLGVYEIPLQGYAVFRSGDNDIPVWRISYLRLTVTDHPVYSVSPAQGPASTIVTITGENFGADPGVGNRSSAENHVAWAPESMNFSVSEKWLPDENILSWSDTQITFKPLDDPDSYKAFPLAGNVSVKANNTDSNKDFTFQLENQIDNISTQTGDSEITVTLTGSSFGNDPGSLFRSTPLEHIRLGNDLIPNSDVQSWSNDTIIFTVPNGSTSGYVAVMSNGFESNSVYLSLGSGSGSIFLPMVIR